MRQIVGRFDNSDRKLVVNAIHDHFGVVLTKMGSRDKWLQDKSGRTWWVLGGRDDWHGIPEEMMDHEEQAENEGILVIAQKKYTEIEMFAGPLTPFISAKKKLYSAKQRDGSYQYHLTVQTKGTYLLCIQTPGVTLNKFRTITYSSEEKERDKKIGELKKIWAAASSEERREIGRMLGAQPDGL